MWAPLLCLTPLRLIVKTYSLYRSWFLRLPRVADGIILLSVRGCRLRFGYEAGGMFKILMGFILCLEFWTLGKTQCKQCIKHVSMMSPRVRDIGRKPLLKQRVLPLPRQLPGASV
jgi:hypothetical protein